MGVNTRTEPVPGHQISVEVQRRLEVDGVLPAKVMRPTDAEDAARGLRLCDLTPAAVVVWGGGTQMRLGTPPRRYDVALDLQGLLKSAAFARLSGAARVVGGRPWGTARSRATRRA